MVIQLAKLDIDVHITTNMSQYKVIEEITSHNEIKNKINFQMSVHPFATTFNYDRLLATMSMIKNRGFSGFALMVGNPLQTYLFEKYKKDINDIGFDLYLQKDESKYGERKDNINIEMRENGTNKFEQKLNNNEKHEKKNDIIECSAGLDYFNINANGEIHRCIWGFKENETLIGNIKYYIENYDNVTEKFIKNPKCKHMSCHKQCEEFMIELWKNKNKIWDSVTWKPKSDKIEDVSINNIWLTICLTGRCVNNCPYCIGKLGPNFKNNCDVNEDLQFINTNDLCDLFTFISKKRNGIKKLEITGGGEPLMHPDFIKIINHATSLDYHVNITTSCLNNIENILFLRNFENISFVISFHPCSKNWDKDKVEKALSFIKDKKPRFIVGSLVKYEGNLKRKEEIQDICNKYNVKLDLYDQIK
jgi:radical SAM protein with 4Fe4S-binding SPASM domain